jgi:hypothetical protein
MRRAMTAALSTGRRYRASRSYRTLRYLLASPGLAYVMLLSFPQLLFGYEVSHNNFKVYTREPIDPGTHAILAKVEARLSASAMSDTSLTPGHKRSLSSSTPTIVRWGPEGGAKRLDCVISAFQGHCLSLTPGAGRRSKPQGPRPR